MGPSISKSLSSPSRKTWLEQVCTSPRSERKHVLASSRWLVAIRLESILKRKCSLAVASTARDSLCSSEYCAIGDCFDVVKTFMRALELCKLSLNFQDRSASEGDPS
eukprot:scaffold209_cov396-Prasinococcus_capsulatus_cf.AAC.9